MPAIPLRFHSLDAMRGLAALGVVFWHWRHFFYFGTQPGSPNFENLPLYDLFFPLYRQGWLAVDLFFTLSGFIFFWLYALRIRTHDMGGRNFLVLRLSRLYPLHVATLLFVAVAQTVLHYRYHSYWVYEANDARHFVLNLLFATSWGFESGFSFNAPVWSVSVEILLYAAFFGLCRLLTPGLPLLVLLAVAGQFILKPVLGPIGEGLCSFFLGGCMFLVYKEILHHNLAARLALPLLLLCAMLWALAITVIHNRLSAAALAQFVVFPVTILTLAVIETVRGTLGRRLAFLGDISYSSYLLHFPLQLAFVGFAAALNLRQSIFYSNWVMLLFFGVLLFLSWHSYHHFELPLQELIRRRWLSTQTVVAAKPA